MRKLKSYVMVVVLSLMVLGMLQNTAYAENVKVVDISQFFGDTSGWKATTEEQITVAADSVKFDAEFATGGYYGQAFQDEAITFTMNTPLVNPDAWPTIYLRSTKPEAQLWEGNDAYYFVIKATSFELACRSEGGEVYNAKFPNDGVFKAGEDNVVEVSCVNTDAGIQQTLKVNGTVVGEYLDDLSVLAEAGYFGISAYTAGEPVTIKASGTVEAVATTNAVDIGRFFGDAANWKATTEEQITVAADSVKFDAEFATGGYYGQAFQDEAITFTMNTPLVNPDAWPTIYLRSTKPEAQLWEGNNAYYFVIKATVFELACRSEGGEVYNAKFPNDGVFKAGEDNTVEVSCVNTDAGIQQTLKVNGTVVGEYLDDLSVLADAGYFGISAYTAGEPVTIKAASADVLAVTEETAEVTPTEAVTVEETEEVTEVTPTEAVIEVATDAADDTTNNSTVIFVIIGIIVVLGVIIAVVVAKRKKK